MSPRTPLEAAIDALLSSGRPIFSLAVISLGIETRRRCARALWKARSEDCVFRITFFP
jgi:hypothetical protein